MAGISKKDMVINNIIAAMGHSKTETTQRYIAKSQARVVQSAARYFNAA